MDQCEMCGQPACGSCGGCGCIGNECGCNPGDTAGAEDDELTLDEEM